MEELKLGNPLKFMSVNQKFGNPMPVYTNMGLTGHNGWDLYALDSTPVYASHDGVVVFAGEDGSGGLGVVIRTHKEFKYGEGKAYYKTIYWHLKTGSIAVKASQSVKMGDRIGLADNTGLSTGSHLHFGLKPVYKGEQDWQWSNAEQNNGYFGCIDPLPFMDTSNIYGLNDYLFFKELKYGDKGDDVAKVQHFLVDKGYMPVPKGYGYYGDLTSKSVLEFQLKNCKLNWYEKNVLKGRKIGQKTLKALNLYK